ncbi:MAG: M28 family metallopeptidase [Promethearchaeota archaeon]
MTDLKIYDENAAINHVKSLEFKRLAETEGEIKTLNYIQRELEKESIPTELESFQWAKTTIYMMKFAFIFILMYVCIYQILLLYSEFMWIILFLDLLLIGIIYIGVKVLFDMTRISFMGKKFESNNIITKVPSKKPGFKKPIIIFTAHYDSISVKYSYKTQLILYITAGLLALVYLALTFILSVWTLLLILHIGSANLIFEIIRITTFIIGIGLIIFLLLIILNKRTNESTGAIDNATGVAILIELAKLLNKNPLNNIDVLFLWCGAEEWGLWGSKQFCSQHFDDLDDEYNLDASYNINLDMVGTYIGMVDSTGLIKKKNINENLNTILESTAKQQNIPLKKSFIPIGAGSDHLTFKAFAKKAGKKMQIACFLSNKDSKYIHSSKDKAENCSTKILNNCIDIIYNSVRSIDLRIE